MLHIGNLTSPDVRNLQFCSLIFSKPFIKDFLDSIWYKERFHKKNHC